MSSNKIRKNPNFCYRCGCSADTIDQLTTYHLWRVYKISCLEMDNISCNNTYIRVADYPFCNKCHKLYDSQTVSFTSPHAEVYIHYTIYLARLEYHGSVLIEKVLQADVSVSDDYCFASAHRSFCESEVSLMCSLFKSDHIDLRCKPDLENFVREF